MLRLLVMSAATILPAVAAATVAGPCGPSAGVGSPSTCAEVAGRTGNVLLIIADDIGVEASTLYPAALRRQTEPPAVETPHLARLARHGLLFRNAWANPSCSPTRATVMTGRYGFRTGMGWPIPPRGARRPVPPLPTDEQTLPETFAAAGSRHALSMVGKWHLSSAREDPVRYGWPDFVGPDPLMEPGAIQNYFHWRKLVGGVTRMSRTYATSDMVNETVRRVRAAREKDRPYFIWLAFNAAHAPFHRPPDHLHGRLDLPLLDAPKRDRYAAMVEALDQELGRLLREVDLADTTVIFMGDNGTPRDIIAPPYDRKHGKLSVYEDGIRVPLLVAGAAVAQPGRIVDGLAQAVDLYPTILELAGIDAAAAQRKTSPIDGVSLMPYLAATATAPVRATAYSEQFVAGDFEDRFERAIRDARYKLIERAAGIGVPEREFFDLANDPHEQRDLLRSNLLPVERTAMNQLRQGMRDLLATRCPDGCSERAAASARAAEESPPGTGLAAPCCDL